MPASIMRSTPAPRSTVDLMEALKRSLAQGTSPKPANDVKAANPAKSNKPKPRDQRQREMLLPIPGKKSAAEERSGLGRRGTARGPGTGH